MSFLFGDGFDCYTQFSDLYSSATYWDSSATPGLDLSSFGRFSGSRGLTTTTGITPTVASLTKSSNVNDAVHHINVAIQQLVAITGTVNTIWLTLFDGATAQCSIVFRSDGVILLTSGASNGTTLATYTGAFPAINTWYGFEIEVVINSTAGSFTVRKNGNTSNDFTLGSLNTRGGTANNYANKLSIGNARGNAAAQVIDDLLWRSDASSVPWAGDVRCYTRMPASDAAATWARSGAVVPVTPFVGTATVNTATMHFSPFVATCSGTVGTAIIQLTSLLPGNMKCTLFNDGAGVPGTVLSSAATINNPVAGSNTFTFASPPSVTTGIRYWLGLATDTVVSNVYTVTASGFAGAYGNSSVTNSQTYASFPSSNPTGLTTGQQANIFTVNITPTTATNANLVAELTPDTGGYVAGSNVGDADLYTLQGISGTPTNIVAVTTRAVAQKSDAGSRAIGLTLKSGSTTSAGASSALNTSFAYVYRTDTVDPNTGAAWTAVAVNNLQVGPTVTV
jgi:hypothetical protein